MKFWWVFFGGFIFLGVFFSLKYTATSRPVEKIRLSFSENLEKIGRYNYIRLWPEIEKTDVYVLGVNSLLNSSAQRELWSGFIKAATIKKTFNQIIVSSDLEKQGLSNEKIIETIGGLKNNKLKNKNPFVFIVPSSFGWELKQKFQKKILFLGIWPLDLNKKNNFAKNYSCKENQKKSIGCEIKARSRSLFRKICQKTHKKGWIYLTDHISQGRYNLYLYKGDLNSDLKASCAH